MVERITSQMLLQTSQRNMQSSMSALARLQSQAGTQKLISKPSDDPAGAGESMRIRADQRALTQYSTNITDGLSWLSTADDALSSATDTMQAVRNLVVQGANSGSLNAASREAIATQLDSLKAALLSTANTTYAGRSIFAGTSDAGVAFDATYTSTAIPGNGVERRVSPTATVKVDVDGVAAFGSGATSTFALIDQITSDLRAGIDITPHLSGVDSALSSILGEQSRVGSRYNQLETSKELNMSQSGSLESQRASVEDVDLSKVILQLKTQEVAYQTALAVTARALQPTLMSFLS
ncbi:MAG: flagellar hook-associated protein FlgL [Salinibacterium sp.]|nr:flagellar hook-associated protein FlgL [Salinibacterium sp.]